MPTGNRTRPPTADILAVLSRIGDPQKQALRASAATRAVRLAFRTTNTTASRWLCELSTMDKPPLLMLSATNGGRVVNVWRNDDWIGDWVSVDTLGLPSGAHGLSDYITLRDDGSQTLSGGHQDITQWVMLAPTAYAMAARVRYHIEARRQEARAREQAEKDAFENAHPRALAVVQELLRRAGVSNHMTEARGLVTGITGRRIDGRMLGAPECLTITLYGDDIPAVAAELGRLGVMAP